MSKAQYKKANSTVFTVLLIILAYIVISLAAFTRTTDPEELTWRVYIQLVVAVVGLIAVVVFFLAKRDSRAGAAGMLEAAAVVYVVIRLFSSTESTIAYAYPILFAAMAYLDTKFIIEGNIIVVAVNVVRMLIHSGELLETGGSNMVANLLVCLLVAYSSMMITKLIMDFDSENVNTIRSSAEENEGSRRTGSAIAENIIANFETAMNVMDELTESILKNRTSMSNIAESTESTAAAIQQQAVMCKDVQDQASNGGALAEDMMGASKEVESTVSEGLTMVRELGEQAENVVAVSNNTVDVVNELTTKVQDVEKFIGTIVNISRQTNLLALNASIEAAGAGEAGKGFAVVAEEIRKLSEETRDASDNITRIITELNNDTERANASLGEAVESVKKQNELIGGTGEKFNKVDIQIQSLITNIGHVRDLIAAAIGATSTVAEKVEVLSASSEEVAAESSEGFAASNRAVDEVEECKNVLKKIKQQADELHANLSVAGR